MKLSVAVVQGGPSAEAEVSRASAKSIARAIDAAGHRAVRLELDGHLCDSLRTGGYDVVFPAVHGAVGEDGSLQGLLEVMELPYVGSDVLASALAMSKPTSKVVFRSAGLPVAGSITVVRGEPSAAERVVRELGDKVVVKPGASGSAIGVAVLPTDIAQALDAAWSVDDVALVETFVEGRELTCGVLDLHGEEMRALPPTEVRSPKDAFYTYEARYAPGRSEHVCPADLPPELIARVQAVAVGAHRTLGCRDLSRVDFVVGQEVVLLEVNTLPGFTDTSLYPEAAAVMGIAMPDLCKRLVESAKRRGTKRRNAPKPLPT